MLDGGVTEDKTFLFEDNKPTGLTYSESNPKGGTVIVKNDGTILLALHNGTWYTGGMVDSGDDANYGIEVTVNDRNEYGLDVYGVTNKISVRPALYLKPKVK